MADGCILPNLDSGAGNDPNSSESWLDKDELKQLSQTDQRPARLPHLLKSKQR